MASKRIRRKRKKDIVSPNLTRPELTDDDDEEFRPSSLYSLIKRRKAIGDDNKEPVASTSSAVFPNPWRTMAPTKVDPKVSYSYRRANSGAGAVDNDVICLNGGSSGTTTSSSARKSLGLRTGVASSLDKPKLGTHMKSKASLWLDGVKNKAGPLVKSLIATRTDTIRLKEKDQYVKLLEQLRRSSQPTGLSTSFSKNSSPADSGRSSQAGVVKQPLTKSKVPLSQLLMEQYNRDFSAPHSQFMNALQTNPEKTIRLLNYSEEPLPPLETVKRSSPKDVELIDITQEESSNSSNSCDSVICGTPVSQLKSGTPPKSQRSSSKKLDDLGKHITEVLNRSLGPLEKDQSVVHLSDDDDDEDVSAASAGDKENGDEIQVLSTSFRREPPSTLVVDIASSPYYSTDWLQKHKSSFEQSRREREEKIKREEKTLEILRRESDLEKDLNEQIRRNLTLTDIIVLEEEEKEAEKLPQITDDMLDVINRARAPGRSLNDVIKTTPNNIEITRSDIKSLAPAQWLNDNVINSYLDMIAARNKSRPNNWPSVYVFTTFFYPKYLNEGYSSILKRWTRKVDLFSFDLLIFPIHLGIHWCLAAADMRHKTIKYYDSLGGKNFQCPKALLQYLRQEHQERKKAPLNDMEWKTEIVEDIPQQQNGSDCGMFACKFAEYLSRDAELNFRQEHMNYYRERMIYEIVAQDLLYP